MNALGSTLGIFLQEFPTSLPLNWQTLPFVADNIVSFSPTEIVVRDASDPGTTTLLGRGFTFDAAGTPIGGVVTGIEVRATDGTVAASLSHFTMALDQVMPIMTSAFPLESLLSGKLDCFNR